MRSDTGAKLNTLKIKDGVSSARAGGTPSFFTPLIGIFGGRWCHRPVGCPFIYVRSTRPREMYFLYKKVHLSDSPERIFWSGAGGAKKRLCQSPRPLPLSFSNPPPSAPVSGRLGHTARPAKGGAHAGFYGRRWTIDESRTGVRISNRCAHRFEMTKGF